MQGVVSLPVLDLRREPSHASEMTSQLILGEVIHRLGRAPEGGWLRVRSEIDGYVGWVRSWGVVEATPVRARNWLKKAKLRVRTPFATVRAARTGASTLAPVVWGSRLIPGKSQGGWRAVELPDGRRGWLRDHELESVHAKPSPLGARIGDLMGVPYLWGGRSPFGFDCSGFTQRVLGEQGVRLPRDAHDQSQVCSEISDRESGRLGDLVFFGRTRRRRGHVGIYLGSGLYAHVRGWVRINSLDPGNMLADNELIEQYLGLGRPPRGWTPARSKIGLTRFQELP